MSTTPTAKVVHADGARSHRAAGNTVTVLVDSDDLESMAVVDYRVAPGFAAPPTLHRHTDLDWVAFVLEGRITFVFDDDEHDASVGDAVVMPRWTPFAWRNAQDEPARMLCVYAPAGFERFFDGLGAGLSEGRPISELVPRLWEQHGIEAVEPSTQER